MIPFPCTVQLPLPASRIRLPMHHNPLVFRWEDQQMEDFVRRTAESALWPESLLILAGERRGFGERLGIVRPETARGSLKSRRLAATVGGGDSLSRSRGIFDAREKRD